MKDRFTIMNEHGEVCFTAEGEFWTLTRKLHVYDHEMNEVIFIRQQLSFGYVFDVIVDGHLFCVVRKKFALKPVYEIEGLDWTASGAWHDHEYEISDPSRVIVSIHKEWMSFGDSYELDVRDPADELPAIAVVLAIDMVLAAQAAAAAA